jgi:8-oxo-dGTP pyrophosphatase MutT (NUDIX family)
LRDKVFKKFKLIRAGGGLVLNGSDAILLIYRRKKWDLPKGKLDKNESIKNCAIREVEEETGLTNVKLNKHLCTTWHIYPEGSKFMLKETDWFQMKVKGQPSLLPQAEEGIEVAKWVTKKELPEYLKNTFPSVRDVLSLL